MKESWLILVYLFIVQPALVAIEIFIKFCYEISGMKSCYYFPIIGKGFYWFILEFILGSFKEVELVDLLL